MSWYEDPRLFICNAYNTASHGFNGYRCRKAFGEPILASELERVESNVQKGSSFDDLLAYLIDSFKRSGLRVWRIVNCQGLTIIWESTNHGTICSWSKEPQDSPYHQLPGIIDAEKEALKKRVPDLESRISTLEADVQREKDEKHDFEKKVSELTSKLKECCGLADEGPWKNSMSIASNINWVPFEHLDVLYIPRNTSMEIIKAPGALKFGEDNTTNVQACRFYGGIYVAAVNVEELIPDKHEARFDKNIWGLYNSAGTNYAVRKLFKSEM